MKLTIAASTPGMCETRVDEPRTLERVSVMLLSCCRWSLEIERKGRRLCVLRERSPMFAGKLPRIIHLQANDLVRVTWTPRRPSVVEFHFADKPKGTHEHN